MLDVKQLKGKINKGCFVNEHVHLGANVGENIMKIGLLGQDGA